MKIGAFFLSLWLLISPAFAVDYVAGSVGSPAGQVIGTSTNDNACVGCVGEILSAASPFSNTTVTITIAAPGIVTWANHGLSAASAVFFTTTGALPTGITASTTLYVCSANLAAGSFALSTSIANALAGTCLTTSGTQSGTQTGVAGTSLATGIFQNIIGMNVTAGDWDCWGNTALNSAGSATINQMFGSLSTSITQVFTPSLTVSSTINDLVSAVTGASSYYLPLSPIRVSVNATTVVYLAGALGFTASTATGNGFLACRRAR